MSDGDEAFETPFEYVAATLVFLGIALFVVACISALNPDPFTTSVYGAAFLVAGLAILAADLHRRDELIEDVDGPQKLDDWERENL